VSTIANRHKKTAAKNINARYAPREGKLTITNAFRLFLCLLAVHRSGQVSLLRLLCRLSFVFYWASK